MNIIIGAHGVGKTTLVNEISKIRSNIFTTDAFSRPIHKVVEKYKIPLVIEQELNTELMLWSTDYYLRFDNTLSTRSIIDSIIYTRLLLPSISTQKLQEKLFKIKPQIKYIFYIPIEFKISNEYSDTMKKNQKVYDKMILDVIREFQLRDKVISISGSIEVRLNKILQYV